MTDFPRTGSRRTVDHFAVDEGHRARGRVRGVSAAPELYHAVGQQDYIGHRRDDAGQPKLDCAAVSSGAGAFHLGSAVGLAIDKQRGCRRRPAGAVAGRDRLTRPKRCMIPAASRPAPRGCRTNSIHSSWNAARARLTRSPKRASSSQSGRAWAELAGLIRSGEFTQQSASYRRTAAGRNGRPHRSGVAFATGGSLQKAGGRLIPINATLW